MLLSIHRWYCLDVYIVFTAAHILVLILLSQADYTTRPKAPRTPGDDILDWTLKISVDLQCATYIVKRVGDRVKVLHFGDGCALVIELVLVIKSGASRGVSGFC